MTGSTSDDIFSSLSSCLQRYDIVQENNWRKLASFASDGCSAMRGVRKGVATMVQQKNPSCITSHCAAHRLQLVAEDTFEQVATFHDVVDDVFTRIYSHFCRSSQRTTEFHAFQKEFNDDETASSVRHFCKTRWLSRGQVVQATLTQLPALLSMFKLKLDSRPGATSAPAPSIPVKVNIPSALPAAPSSVPAPEAAKKTRKRSRVDQLQDKLSAAFAPATEKRRHVMSSRAREGAEQEHVLALEEMKAATDNASSSTSSSCSSTSTSSSSFSSSSSAASTSSLYFSPNTEVVPPTPSKQPAKLDPLHSLFDDARSIEFLGLLSGGADMMPLINALSCEFQRRDLFAYDVFSRVNDCITQIEGSQKEVSTRLFRRVESALDRNAVPRIEGTKVEIDCTVDRVDLVKIDVDALPVFLVSALKERFPSGGLMAASKIFVPASHPASGLSSFGWDDVATICKHYAGLIDADALRREYPVIRSRLAGELGGMTVFAAWERLLSDESFVSRYPNMCRIASLFLIVMPTSVDCERAFSTMSLIKTKLRNQLEIESTDALMRIAMNGPPMTDVDNVNTLICDAHRSFYNAKVRRHR